jgi:hypothetical protein
MSENKIEKIKKKSFFTNHVQEQKLPKTLSLEEANKLAKKTSYQISLQLQSMKKQLTHL